MKKVLISLALLALPALASAQTFCEGRPYDATNSLSLAWDSCWFPGSTATSFKTLNCLASPTTNATGVLHFQFKVPVEVASSVSATGIVDIVQQPGSPLPQFYHYEATGCAGSGTIKGVAFGIFPAPGACTGAGFGMYCDDGSAGNACIAQGQAYAPDTPVIGVGRFALVAVRGSGTALTTGTNYWLWQLTFNNRLRNACAGCASPASIIWQSLGLEQDDGQANLCLTGPDSEKGPDRGGFNSGGIGGPTPVQNTTWGQIKALYR